MASPAENANLIRQKARQYVLSRGGSEADARAFGDTLIGISWVESGLGQQPVGDQGQSHGLFHTHVGGRNLSGVGQRAGSAQQLAAALADPNLDIDNSMPELFEHFQRHGGGAGYQRNPGSFVANVALTGQRPSRAAWEKVVQSGGYAKGVEIAQGAQAPASGSPLQAAAGLPSASGLNQNIMNAAPTRRVFPVQGYQGDVALHWGEHTGATDIFAAPGTPIQAMVGGTVESVGSEGPGGHNITIRGDDGLLYYYAHMIGPPAVKQGRVEKGQVIGGVGDTGNAKGTGAHLHIGIGPSIARGVGPAGGAGEGFDAVSLLRETLGGGSTYVGQQSGSAGGPQMATPPAFTYTSPYKDQITGIQSQVTKGQERLAALTAKGAAMTEAEFAEFASLRAAIPDLQKQLIDLTKIDQDERQFAWEQHQANIGQRADAASGIAGLRQQGFTNQLGIIEAVGNIANSAFGQRLDLAGLVNSVLEGNRAARLQELNTMIAMGELDMAQAAMRFDVQERQQAAELAWTVQAANKAGWIADEERKNALMFLPEGTHFQPGFEPNGALNATFAKYGIPPMVIGVAEVDRSRFDPEQNLRRGANIQTELGAPLPAFDTAETTAAADRVRGTAGTDVSLGRISPSELNLPAPTNADALIDRLPASPDTADIEAFLQGLMNQDVGIPPSAAATPPPEPPSDSRIGSQFPMIPGTTTITKPTSSPSAAARATVEAAAGPAGLARRDVAGLPVVKPNQPTSIDRAVDPGAALVAGQRSEDATIRGPTKPLGDEDESIAETIWNWLKKKPKRGAASGSHTGSFAGSR